MKCEYSNILAVSTNSISGEVVITFQQETVNHVFERDEQGKETARAVPEKLDVVKVALTSFNAQQLAALLNSCLNQMSTPEESENGEQ